MLSLHHRPTISEDASFISSCPSPLRVHQILSKFSDLHVLVVGDVYLDNYQTGSVADVSRETPVPVLEFDGSAQYSAGAAANVACNLSSLGAGKVSMLGVIGTDENGEILLSQLHKYKVDTSLVIKAEGRTNTYTKLLGRRNLGDMPQEMLLTNQRQHSSSSPLCEDRDLIEQIVKNISKIVSEVDAIYICDQIGSVVTEEVSTKITDLQAQRESNLTTVASSRTRCSEFRYMTALIPNYEELCTILNAEQKVQNFETDSELCDHLSHLGRKAVKITKPSNLMITLGERGVFVLGEQNGSIYPAAVCDVVDVTGAGDTFGSLITLGLASNFPMDEIAPLANLAASVAVENRGTTKVTADDVYTKSFRLYNEPRAPSASASCALTDIKTLPKLQTLTSMTSISQKLKSEGLKIVWMNGCFDLLHPGHVSALEKAKQQGDILIVGMNSDTSVTSRKGSSRPILNEFERATMLCALECVDFLVIFSEASSYKCLEKIKPHIQTVGSDYDLNTMNQEERGLVESCGGRVVCLRDTYNISTSLIVQKIEIMGRVSVFDGMLLVMAETLMCDKFGLL